MSDDRDLRSYTRRGALGLMGAGGVLAATETLGFTQLTADRGVGITVSGDNASGFKITANGSGLNDTTSADEILSLTFTNNTGTDFDGNSLSKDKGLVVEISTSNDTDVDVRNGGGDQNFSTTPINVSSGSSGTVATNLPSSSSDTAKLDIENPDTTDATVDLRIVATDSNNQIRIDIENTDTTESDRESITIFGPPVN
ncbi:MAG: hypothetical protein A07HR67_02762 [uncultured archaeon A07HR67]|nr:MAG: hypothetical protein A07HR67_02762 [uncultured archaeon A07HR67]